jgi:hypothetical protein
MAESPKPDPLTTPVTSTGALGSAKLYAVDIRTQIIGLLIAALIGAGGVSTAVQGRLPDEARTQIAQAAEASKLAATSSASAATAAERAATAATTAASSSATAASSAAEATRAATTTATAIDRLTSQINDLRMGLNLSDKERERMQRQVDEHETRLRALETPRR